MPDILIEVLLGTLIIGLLTFVFSYYFWSNWRSTQVGRYTMYFNATVAGTFLYIFISQFFDDNKWKIIPDLLILILLNFGAWQMVWLLLKIQRQGRKSDNDTIE